mmetsp:Transcript_20289/g.41668  ORF Transcript_20289/g.41668 Transcript_20289/m.41668 type:complete len:231 (-) Transcript_20289:1070-1762(-)
MFSRSTRAPSRPWAWMPTTASVTSTRRSPACLQTRRRSSRMISQRRTRSVRRSPWSTLTRASPTSTSPATSSLTTPCPQPSAAGARCGTPMTRRRTFWPPSRTVAMLGSSASALTSARRTALSTPRPWGHVPMSVSWLRRPRSMAPTRLLSRPSSTARFASLRMARISCSWGTRSPLATSGGRAKSRTFQSRTGSSWPSRVAAQTTSRTTTSLARRSSGWTRHAPMTSSS